MRDHVGRECGCSGHEGPLDIGFLNAEGSGTISLPGCNYQQACLREEAPLSPNPARCASDRYVLLNVGGQRASLNSWTLALRISHTEAAAYTYIRRVDLFAFRPCYSLARNLTTTEIFEPWGLVIFKHLQSIMASCNTFRQSGTCVSMTNKDRIFANVNHIH